MKKALIVFALTFSPAALQAEFQQVNLTVFGMDCAPCAHAIHVSMKGIEGVNKCRCGPEYRSRHHQTESWQSSNHATV